MSETRNISGSISLGEIIKISHAVPERQLGAAFATHAITSSSNQTSMGPAASSSSPDSKLPTELISSSSSLSSPASSAASLLAYLVTYSMEMHHWNQHDDINAYGGGMPRTLDLHLVILGVAHKQRRSVAVQRIGRIRVAEKLWEEDFEDVDHVEHW